MIPFNQVIQTILGQYTQQMNSLNQLKKAKQKSKAESSAQIKNLGALKKLIPNHLLRLQNNATKIGYQLRPGQEVPTGIIPRMRLIDPSVIWDIITYPEDITRVLAYVWVAPTQYQIYTAPGISTLKFIYQQIPSDQVD